MRMPSLFKKNRVKAEAEAKRVSEQIDQEFKQERLERGGVIKLLVLGQADSGKTTLIKQFYRIYKPHLFEPDPLSLEAVIYFNVVRCLKTILTTIEAWDDTTEGETDYSSGPHSRRLSDQPSPSTSSLDAGASQIAALRRRLRPLVTLDCESHDGVQDIAHMLRTLENDIKELWDHTTIKALIAKRRLKLDGNSEFFLKHISRVLSPAYIPTTDDILHAGIQTMNVQEHKFDVNNHGKIVTWHLHDVGGARGQRHSWVPCFDFDDISAIVFMVPISSIDQYLEEDPRINRLEDSFQLLAQICSNRLLKSASFMLILSKIDLLKKKLDRGLEVRKYVTSFDEQKNDLSTVIQHFHRHFLEVYRRNNICKRTLYTRWVNMIDIKATHNIIDMVHDSIVRAHLESTRI